MCSLWGHFTDLACKRETVSSMSRHVPKVRDEILVNPTFDNVVAEKHSLLFFNGERKLNNIIKPVKESEKLRKFEVLHENHHCIPQIFVFTPHVYDISA